MIKFRYKSPAIKGTFTVGVTAWLTSVELAQLGWVNEMRLVKSVEFWSLKGDISYILSQTMDIIFYMSTQFMHSLNAMLAVLLC